MATSCHSNESLSEEITKDNEKPVRVVKTPVDLQRLKLEKLMNNPTKEIIIPDKSKEKAPRAPLEFIRNIWAKQTRQESCDDDDDDDDDEDDAEDNFAEDKAEGNSHDSSNRKDDHRPQTSGISSDLKTS
ncbi:prkr interacting protein 1 (il11 inducible) [Plakobranchus ocellatus]|uniref:Prkr interacting protein 1 (Il11 inducible) n=1 Tax=Plakobranchus ocellatus TaxID=259542 RepID=A0AAV3Y3S2_9GAST|nr:prkr interacting protein 1 (il11 inducible) [Plakobranchus ocellatus]